MACFFPVDAHLPEGGGKLLFGKDPLLSRGKIAIPCGRCIGCRLDRTSQWMVRCVHESRMHDENCFITLTYDDQHLPYGADLFYPHFQDFMRKLRRRVGKVRFYMCGEYGTEFHRPHFHACLFGFMPADISLLSDSGAGRLYKSSTLFDSWTDEHGESRGFSSVANFSSDTAAYVAGYIQKKITGDMAESHYAKLVPETGEIIQRTPEFSRMSTGRIKGEGIGGPFFMKYGAEIFPRDFCRVDGREVKVPRYYDKLEASRIGIAFDEVSHKRAVRALESSGERTHDRLRARESVTRARLSSKVRKLK